MPDQNLLPALARALQVNEIGNESAYKLSFAGKGKSGASFGIMQGDLAAHDSRVTACFHDVMAASGWPESRIAGAIKRLSVPLTRSPLPAADLAAIDAALASPRGRQLVDAMDEYLLDSCFTHLDSCIATAQHAGHRIAPEAQIAIVLWINMTGPPTTLLQWLGGAAVVMAKPVPPPDEYVTGAEITAFLQASHYFTDNPGTMPHFQQAVTAGVSVLPSVKHQLMFAATVGWYVFEQATGQFIQHGLAGDELLDPTGYSGSFSAGGINNPDKQYEKLVGPIPQGQYSIGAATNFPTKLAFPLAPVPGTDTRGRDGFMIHGGCLDGTLRASTGCIIVDVATRTRIASGGASILKVVHG